MFNLFKSKGASLIIGITSCLTAVQHLRLLGVQFKVCDLFMFVSLVSRNKSMRSIHPYRYRCLKEGRVSFSDKENQP